MRRLLMGGIVLMLLGATGVAVFLWSGVYNMAADDEHWPPVYRTLELLRERSVAVRASQVAVPDLADAELVRKGAGNYEAMCAGCHLRPGESSSELSRGLYPRPPRLSETRPASSPARDFWIIKHGIKASGMPAWGKSMADAHLWGLTAFVQRLPTLDAAAYQQLVASSDGHSHGGGEDHHGPQALAVPEGGHLHKDGSVHHH